MSPIQVPDLTLNFCAHQRVLLFSGGCDSAALLHLLQRRGEKFSLLHFNHGLRPESMQEEDFCRNLAKQLNLPLRVIRLELDGAIKGSIEDRARQARQESLRTEFDCSKTLFITGHHADDRQEHFLLRLMRGANSASLTSLREYGHCGNLNFWRPLIDVSRQQLTHWMESARLSWCEDQTNADSNYCQRNTVRHQLLPQLRQLSAGETGQGFVNSMDHLQQESDFLHELAQEKLKTLKSVTDWNVLPPALKPRVLRLFVKEQSGEDFVPSQAALARMDEECSRVLMTKPRSLPLGQSNLLFIEADGRLSSCLDQVSEEQKWHWRSENTFIWGSWRFSLTAAEEHDTTSFSATQLGESLLLRVAQANDEILLPSGKMRSLKKIYSDKKLTQAERRTLPLMVNCEGEILLWGTQRNETGSGATAERDPLGRRSGTRPAGAQSEQPSKLGTTNGRARSESPTTFWKITCAKL